MAYQKVKTINDLRREVEKAIKTVMTNLYPIVSHILWSLCFPLFLFLRGCCSRSLSLSLSSVTLNTSSRTDVVELCIFGTCSCRSDPAQERRYLKKIDINYLRATIGVFLHRTRSVKKHGDELIIDEHN